MLFASVSSAATINGYTSFFVFGDSLSDSGNLFAATGGALPADPPYFNGRFSNGPVWAEGVAAEFTSQSLFAANFAFGGAQAVTDLDPVPDLSFQVSIFGATVPTAAFGFRPLASLWFGANDLFAALDDFADGSANLDDVEAVGRAAATAVTDGAKSLLTAGIRDVLILNLPDLGSLPAYALFKPGSAPAATAGSVAFNAELDVQVDQLRILGLNVTEIDIYGLFGSLLSDPTQFGVLNATHPCFVPGVSLCTPEQALNLAFFDPVHPTATIHAAVQQQALAAIAPIPLPLPVVFLGTGLVALFGVSHRRKTAPALTA
jgi:outer membrane lipase/esterase